MAQTKRLLQSNCSNCNLKLQERYTLQWEVSFSKQGTLLFAPQFAQFFVNFSPSQQLHTVTIIWTQKMRLNLQEQKTFSGSMLLKHHWTLISLLFWFDTIKLSVFSAKTSGKHNYIFAFTETEKLCRRREFLTPLEPILQMLRWIQRWKNSDRLRCLAYSIPTVAMTLNTSFLLWTSVFRWKYVPYKLHALDNFLVSQQVWWQCPHCAYTCLLQIIFSEIKLIHFAWSAAINLT